MCVVNVFVMCVGVLSRLGHVRLFVTLWTVARQAPLSMGFSRQEYWSGLPCSPPGDLPTQGSNLSLLSRPHWQAGSLPPVLPGKPSVFVIDTHKGTALLWSNNPRNSDQ